MTQVEQILKQAQKLSPQERSVLIARLQAENRSGDTASQGRAWREIAGIAPGLMGGLDAQEWISRNRQVADGERTTVL